MTTCEHDLVLAVFYSTRNTQHIQKGLNPIRLVAAKKPPLPLPALQVDVVLTPEELRVETSVGQPLSQASFHGLLMNLLVSLGWFSLIR